MKKIILYGSKYGSAKRYGEELARRTGIVCQAYDSVHSLEGCSCVIHLGGLYAGGVLGLDHTVDLLKKRPGAKLWVVTVGLSDPAVEANRNNIRNSLKKRLPPEIYEAMRLFHLRGGIDYSRLSFLHRGMMKLLYHQLKKLPPEEWNEETRGLIETYGRTVDFVDFESLNELEEALSKTGENAEDN